MLTARERKFLTKYRQYRENPKTIKLVLWQWAVYFVLAFATLVFAATFVAAEFACFIGGLLLGSTLNGVMKAYRGFKLLPLMFEIIDWEKVDRLLDEPPTRQSQITQSVSP